MCKAIIDGASMLTREAAHLELARALDLPEYYGKNLDALWDCATTMEASLTLVHPAALLNALGVYGCKLLQTLFEATDENAYFHFQIEN